MFSFILKDCGVFMKNILIKLCGLLATVIITPQIANSATLTNFTVTPADLTTGVTTTYTIQFDAASTISTSPFRALRFITGSGGANFSNATIDSTSANISLSCGGCNATSAYMSVTGGSVAPGETVTIVMGNVLNPVTPGLGNNYRMDVEDSSYSDVDTATISGSVYINNTGPVVTNPIPNQTIESQYGAQAIDLESGVGVSTDLNYTFTDGDGDNLTFAVIPGHDTNVVTASVVNDELILTGQNTGSTSITIEADDNDEGTITDTFDVTVYGSLGPASVTPASTVAGETTSYTFTFRAATTLNDGDFVILNTEAGNQNQNNSTLQSISGGGLTGTVSNNSETSSVVWFNGGNATPGTTVTVVLNNIVNPGASGQAADYEIRTTDGGNTTGTIDVAGTVFGSTSTPTVVNLIPDQSINQEDGSIVVDLNSGAGVNTDLNYTFEDGDGHPLTFTIESIGDTNVVTAAVVNDELVITGQGTGNTTVTVRASDGIDGFVSDSFNVSVVGHLVPVSVTPSSLFAGEQETYTIVFSPATALDSGDFIIFSTTAGGPDQTNSSIQQLSGGSLTGSITAGSANSTVVMFDGGSASTSDTVTLVLANIFNPIATGMAPDYDVRTTDGGSATGISTVAGDNFTASDLIYENSFEQSLSFQERVKVLLNEITQQAKELTTKLPELNTNFNAISFYGLQLNLVEYSHDESMVDILSWLEAVLVAENPDGDFDGDGVSNIDDTLPFSL